MIKVLYIMQQNRTLCFWGFKSEGIVYCEYKARQQRSSSMNFIPADVIESSQNKESFSCTESSVGAFRSQVLVCDILMYSYNI